MDSSFFLGHLYMATVAALHDENLEVTSDAQLTFLASAAKFELLRTILACRTKLIHWTGIKCVVRLKKFSLEKMCNAEMVGERGEIKPSCLKNILHNLQQCFGLEGTSVAFLFAHVLVKIVENFVNRAQVVLQVVLPGGTVIAQNADEHSSPAI
jgi:hypothetical protein